MRRLQGGGTKRQVNPLCQTAGGDQMSAVAGKHGGKNPEMKPRQQWTLHSFDVLIRYKEGKYIPEKFPK